MPNHNLYLASRDSAGNKQLIPLGLYEAAALNGSWDVYLASRDAAGNTTLVTLDANYLQSQVPPVFTSASTISAVQQATTTHELTASDGNGDALSFSIPQESAWPSWVTLSGSVITARPTAGIPVGDYEITVQVSDSNSLVSQSITVTVEPFDGFAVPIHNSRVINRAQTVVHKDPDEVLDFWINLSNRLKQDEIESIDSITITPSGDPGQLVEASRHVNSVSVADTDGVIYEPEKVVSLWLTAGIAGESYLVNTRVTTKAGRVYDADVWFRCMQDPDAR